MLGVGAGRARHGDRGELRQFVCGRRRRRQLSARLQPGLTKNVVFVSTDVVVCGIDTGSRLTV
jgi:hypothetical protein